CSAFLYTHIETEGTMTGFPLEIARRLRQATTRRLMVAGGIRSSDEVEELDSIGVDAVVGMAIYKGAIGGEQLIEASLWIWNERYSGNYQSDAGRWRDWQIRYRRRGRSNILS